MQADDGRWMMDDGSEPLLDHERQEEAESPEDGAIVAIDANKLLDALDAARRADTLALLRDHIVAEHASIEAAESPQNANNSSPTVFPRAYILGELEQIAAAQTLERARYYIDRLVKALTEERTSPINDLNLNRWKEYDDILTDSFWDIKRRDRSSTHAADYWGNFIPQIPNQMMRRYTKRGEWVLDVFAGSGTTLIEALRLGRNCLGVELQPHVAERARERLADTPNPHAVDYGITVGDSTTADFSTLLREHGAETAQLVMMHPPYYDIIKFSEDARDLSNAASVDAFLERMGQVVERAAAVLARGRYLVLVIGDKYVKGEWIPLGFQAMNVVQQRGFVLKSIVVKNFEETAGKRAQKELWKYRALVGGFYVFKHEYIFIFKKK
jgi:16S rRNA G966 N2-methylase RsmD